MRSISDVIDSLIIANYRQLDNEEDDGDGVKNVMLRRVRKVKSFP